jgi:Rieske Fe-S protein
VGDQWKVTIAGADGVVLVVRTSATEVHAVQMYCTHFGSEVALVPGEDGGAVKLRCTNHGAEYDLEGAVLKGPASNPLRRYVVTTEEGKLYLTVPG